MQIEEAAGTPNKFIVLRQEVMADRSLTISEKVVYARIATFDEYFESCEDAGRLLGLSAVTVRRAKQKLVKLGYIKEVLNTGRGKRYKPIYDLKSAVDVNQTDKICQSDGQNMSIRLTKYVNIDKNIEKNIEYKNERTKKSISYESVIDNAVADEKLRELLKQHLALRSLNRWPKLTNDGLRMKISELMNKANQDPIVAQKMVEESLKNGWRGFFTLKDDTSTTALDQELYQDSPNEDITWKHILDVWGKALGHRPPETRQNVEAIKRLLAEYGEDNTLRMVGALAMRAKENRYLTKDIKSVSTPAELLQNKDTIWNYYQVHAETWARRADNNGKRPWQL